MHGFSRGVHCLARDCRESQRWCHADVSPLTLQPSQVRFHGLEYATTLASPWAVELKARYLEYVGAVKGSGRRTMLGGQSDSAAADGNTQGDGRSPRDGRAEGSRQAARAEGLIDLDPSTKAEIEKLATRSVDAFPSSPWIHLFAAHLRVRRFSAAAAFFAATVPLPSSPVSARFPSIGTLSWRHCTAPASSLARCTSTLPFLRAVV